MKVPLLPAGSRRHHRFGLSAAHSQKVSILTTSWPPDRAWLPPEYNALRASEWLSPRSAYLKLARARQAQSFARQPPFRTRRLDIIGVEETTATFTGGKLQGRAIKRAGAIELSSTPVKVPPEQASAALADGIRTEGLSLFTFSDKAQSLRERLNFLHAQLGEPWPNVESADPEYWLGPELNAMAHGASPKNVDMHQALQRLMPWPEANSLDELAPARLSVPSGSHPRIDYSTGRPVVRVAARVLWSVESRNAPASACSFICCPRWQTTRRHR